MQSGFFPIHFEVPNNKLPASPAVYEHWLRCKSRAAPFALNHAMLNSDAIIDALIRPNVG